MSTNGPNMVGRSTAKKNIIHTFLFTQVFFPPSIWYNGLGTCSGMSQRAYFVTALSLYVEPTPHTFIKDHYGEKVRAEDITEAYGGAGIAFPQCKGSYFEGVNFCVQPKRNMSPVPCPEGIERELERKNCKGTVIMERFFEVS